MTRPFTKKKYPTDSSIRRSLAYILQHRVSKSNRHKFRKYIEGKHDIGDYCLLTPMRFNLDYHDAHLVRILELNHRRYTVNIRILQYIEPFGTIPIFQQFKKYTQSIGHYKKAREKTLAEQDSLSDEKYQSLLDAIRGKPEDNPFYKPQTQLK